MGMLCIGLSDPEQSIKESLEVFERVFHSPKLRQIPVILLLNKARRCKLDPGLKAPGFKD